MLTKPFFLMFPTLLPGIQVMVTNRVGNQTMQGEYIVYEYCIPSNEATQWIGHFKDMQLAVIAAQERACVIENFVSALPKPGEW